MLIRPYSITLTVAAALLALVACSKEPQEKKAEGESAYRIGEVRISAEAQAKFQFATARPQRMVPVRLIEATAGIAPDPARVAHLAPIAKGRLVRLHVQTGDSVSRGTPLFDYDNIELGEAVGDFMAELADLQRDLALVELSRKSWERARLLLEIEAIARKEVEVREAEHRATEAAVANRRARITRVKEKLYRFGMTEDQIRTLSADDSPALHRQASYTVVRAPLDGVVITLNAAPGEIVGPEKVLLEIADLSSVWALVDIYEKDLAQVRRGAPVEIKVEAYPDEIFRGTIAYVSDILDAQTRSAKVRVEIPNAQRKFKPGMFATVRLRVQAGAGTGSVLAIPSSAIQQVDGQPVVFVKMDAVTFKRRAVKPGGTSGDLVEVIEGLKGDEEVVTADSFALKSELLKERISEGQ